MTKLDKRQNIIVILAIAVVLYGAYTLFTYGKGRKETKKSYSQEESNSLNGITSDLMKNTLSSTDAYIVGRAASVWNKNPFWIKGAYQEWASKDSAKTTDDPSTKIIYSGYVDTGKKKMAVINGLEYSVGDKLEISGYILKKITAAKVVVGNHNQGSELEIFIQE